jgi:hypothetical protein
MHVHFSQQAVANGNAALGSASARGGGVRVRHDASGQRVYG